MKVLKITPAELDMLMQRWQKEAAVYVPAFEKPAAASVLIFSLKSSSVSMFIPG